MITSINILVIQSSFQHSYKIQTRNSHSSSSLENQATHTHIQTQALEKGHIQSQHTQTQNGHTQTQTLNPLNTLEFGTTLLGSWEMASKLDA